MLTLNKNPSAFPKTHSFDFGSPAVETRLINKFDDVDIASKADIITELWQKCHSASAGAPLQTDVSEPVALGMKLYDCMDSAAQLLLVQDRINESAAQIFYAAVRRQIQFEQLDKQLKARLCTMTLSFLERSNAVDDATLMDFYMNIVHLLKIPQELTEMIFTNVFMHSHRLMEKSLLDTAIQLLANSREGFFTTSTLLYNPDDFAYPFNVASYIKEISDLWRNNAIKKLRLLMPGQKLMIPIQSTSIDNKTLFAMDGHFCAILAMRAKKSYRIYIFDSNSSPNTKDNIPELIMNLIEENEKPQCFYFRQPFQDNNDCGFHTYNFFKLCLAAPAGAFDNDPRALRKMFDDYVQPLDSRNYLFDQDSKFISYRLRTQFVLDCIKNGYTDGLQNAEYMISLLRQPPDSSWPVMPKRQDSRRTVMLWNNLRSRLENVFSLKRSNSNTKVKNNSDDIQKEEWVAIYNADRGNAECHKEMPE